MILIKSQIIYLDCSAFPVGGLLVLTLGSLWFFENVGGDVDGSGGYKASKLPLDGAFWSMRFDANTRLVLVTTRPAPHSRQVALELRYFQSQ